MIRSSNAAIHTESHRLRGASRDELDAGSEWRTPWKELQVVIPSRERNWRGIALAVGVILLVCSLIFGAVFVVRTEETFFIPSEDFTFDDIFREDFVPKRFEAHWNQDSDGFVFESSLGELVHFDIRNNKTSTIMLNTTFRLHSSKNFILSALHDYVLIPYSIEKMHTHSFVASYALYSLPQLEASFVPISFPQNVKSGEIEQMRLQLVSWAPAGSSLAFVHKNNLFYQPSPHSTSTQATFDGNHFTCNAIPDWIYEEEILHSNSALWWSKNASYLAFAKFIDANVREFRYAIYADNDVGWRRIPYPMTNASQPIVKLLVVKTSDVASEHWQIGAPDHLLEHYLCGVQWADDTHILVTWANRQQTRLIRQYCDAVEEICFEVFTEESPVPGPVKMTNVHFNDNSSGYITLLPKTEGNAGHWMHIASISLVENATEVFVTNGLYDVATIVHYDGDDIYFLSNYGVNVSHKHLYRTTASSSPECLSCGDPSCQFVNVSFSGSHFYILECLGPGFPTYILKSTQPGFSDIVLEDNSALDKRLMKISKPEYKPFEFKINANTSIYGTMLVHPRLNENKHLQFPVLIHVNDQLNSQQVTEEYRTGWQTYLTTFEQVIYVTINGRGSSGRGVDFMHSTYKKLGTTDVQDHIAAAKYLRDTFYFVDADSIAIWGQAYGGFVAAHVLGRNQNVINCGISVAPITDWRYINSAYAERHMGLCESQDNLHGYEAANLSSKAESFRAKKFLLIHGTADEEIPWQNTVHLSRALTAAGVEYHQHTYTDKGHHLGGHATRRHFYRMMTSFLRRECWKGVTIKDVL